jgi:hypothetical protein
MPDVSADERGRRRFQIQKERAVEAAVTKIRQKQGPDWTAFSVQDIQTLQYILGEAWVSIKRSVWEQYAFTRLSRDELRDIIRIGNEVKDQKIREETGINDVCRILRGSITE